MNYSKESLLISVDPDDFSFICSCAVRYALGRRTYAVSIVTEFVLAHLEQLDIRAKTAIIHDIEIQKDLGDDAYGDECDQKLWLNLLEQLKDRMPQA